MPTDPNHAYADTPHPATIQPAGYRYGCHGTTRGGWHEYSAHPWARRGMRPVATTWLPISCGHATRATDAACEGCCNRGDA